MTKRKRKRRSTPAPYFNSHSPYGALLNCQKCWGVTIHFFSGFGRPFGNSTHSHIWKCSECETSRVWGTGAGWEI